MSRQSFYEPMIDEGRQATPIRGFQTQIAGTYVLLDDVITSLREYAQSLEDSTDGALIHEVAAWLQSSERELPAVESTAAVEAPPPAVHADDPAVDRVEIYPDDPASLRPRWIARSCDENGRILFITNGSFDQEYVIKDASERWPGKNVHLLTEAGIDTVWEERDPGGIRSASSGRRRPSPNRMWA